jgi:hypothetical protein
MSTDFPPIIPPSQTSHVHEVSVSADLKSAEAEAEPVKTIVEDGGVKHFIATTNKAASVANNITLKQKSRGKSSATSLQERRFIPISLWAKIANKLAFWSKTTQKTAHVFDLTARAEKKAKKLQNIKHELERGLFPTEGAGLDEIIEKAKRELDNINFTIRQLSETEETKERPKPKSAEFLSAKVSLRETIEKIKNTYNELNSINKSSVGEAIKLTVKINTNLKLAKQKTHSWYFSPAQERSKIEEARNALVNAKKDLKLLKERQRQMNELETIPHLTFNTSERLHVGWEQQGYYDKLEAQYNETAQAFFRSTPNDEKLLDEFLVANEQNLSELYHTHGVTRIADLWDHLEAQAIIENKCGDDKDPFITKLTGFRSQMELLRVSGLTIKGTDNESIYEAIDAERDRSIKDDFIVNRYPEKTVIDRLVGQGDDLVGHKEIDALNYQKLSAIINQLKKLQTNVELQANRFISNQADMAFYDLYKGFIKSHLEKFEVHQHKIKAEDPNIETVRIQPVGLEDTGTSLAFVQMEKIFKFTSSMLEDLEVIAPFDKENARKFLVNIYQGIKSLSDHLEIIKDTVSPREYLEMKQELEKQQDTYYRIAKEHHLFAIPDIKVEQMNKAEITHYLEAIELNVIANDKLGFWSIYNLLGDRERIRIRFPELYNEIQEKRLSSVKSKEAAKSIAQIYNQNKSKYQMIGQAAYLAKLTDEIVPFIEKFPAMGLAFSQRIAGELKALQNHIKDRIKVSEDPQLIEMIEHILVPTRTKLDAVTFESTTIPSISEEHLEQLSHDEKDIEKYQNFIKTVGSQILFVKGNKPDIQTKTQFMALVASLLGNTAILMKVQNTKTNSNSTLEGDPEVQTILSIITNVSEHRDLWLDFFIDPNPANKNIKSNANLIPIYTALIKEVPDAIIEQQDKESATTFEAFLNFFHKGLSPHISNHVRQELLKLEKGPSFDSKDGFRNKFYQVVQLAMGIPKTEHEQKLISEMDQTGLSETEQKRRIGRDFDYAKSLESIEEEFDKQEKYLKGHIEFVDTINASTTIPLPERQENLIKPLSGMKDGIGKLQKQLNLLKKEAAISGNTEAINELKIQRLRLHALKQKYNDLVDKAFPLEEETDLVKGLLGMLSTTKLEHLATRLGEAKISELREERVFMKKLLTKCQLYASGHPAKKLVDMHFLTFLTDNKILTDEEINNIKAISPKKPPPSLALEPKPENLVP